MGLGYGFDIFCHRDKLWEFIDSVVELNKPSVGYSTTFTYGDQQKTVPLYFKGQHSTLDLTDPENDDGICLSLPFTIDDEVHQYLEDVEEKALKQDPSYIKREPEIDSENCARIGCIYFYIVSDQDAIGRAGFDTGLVAFEFRAATNRMSLLFQESESVQRTFVELAKRHDAVYCLFSSGGSNKAKVLWLDGQEYSVGIPDDWLTMTEVRRIVANPK